MICLVAVQHGFGQPGFHRRRQIRWTRAKGPSSLPLEITEACVSNQRPADVAYDLRFRAAVQDQVARTAESENVRRFASNFAKQLRVQANLIDQGVPIERVLRSQSDKI